MGAKKTLQGSWFLETWNLIDLEEGNSQTHVSAIFTLLSQHNLLSTSTYFASQSSHAQ